MPFDEPRATERYYRKMGSFFRDLAKAELHIHLEGSVWPETLLELDPSLDEEEVRRRYRYDDFLGFIESFKWVLGFLKGPDEYALAARRLLARLAAENVTYAEITIAGAGILRRGLDFGAIYDVLAREARSSEVDAWWIVDAARQFGPEEAMEVARLAASRAGGRIVAFGLGGIEAEGPVERFADVIAFAKGHGLHFTPHAGETMGPESVRAALDAGADRIGHGIRAAEDPALLRRLHEENIPLEVCLTSNFATGVVASLKEHPIRQLYEAGVPITLNSDDPAMFDCDLSSEYELAEKAFGFTRQELEGLVANSFRFGFRSRH